MKITDVRTMCSWGPTRTASAASSARWHVRFVRIDTDGGMYGLGEPAELLRRPRCDRLRPRVADRARSAGDPPVRAGDAVRRPAAVRPADEPDRDGHGAAAWAASGVEMALCDIAGKASGTPAYNLLGGAFRDRIRVYLDRSGVADPSDLGAWRALARAGHGRRLRRLQVRRGVDRAGGQPRPVEPPDAQRPDPPDRTSAWRSFARSPGPMPRSRSTATSSFDVGDRHPPGAGPWSRST